MPAGYSGTPLARKLGIRTGSNVLTVGAPEDYLRLLDPLPERVTITDRPCDGLDIVHVFSNERDELFQTLAKCRQMIVQNGAIWVSWFKRAARIPTEITEDVIREAAFPLGLVDVKVCAVDDKWSGLKLVIRRENRV